MIKTTKMLIEELSGYTNPNSKIRRMVDSGELIPVIRGLYETDKTIPGYYLAPAICGPSYLSFEFSLAFHSLIPEAVYNFTSATFEKKRTKRYDTPYGTFIYRDVPSRAYPADVRLYTEKGYGFMVASPEKAVCDQLYKISPLKNKGDLEHFLFMELRLDEDDFFTLDISKMYEIARLFNTKNHDLLRSYIRRK